MIEKLINIANAEIGYLEKKSNKDLDSKTANAGNGNYTKYARDLDNIPNFYNGKKNGYAWCDVFVDWLFVQAFGVDKAKELLLQPNGSLGAGCTYSARYYKNANQYHKTPKVGDQIFFTNSKGSIVHTGIVYKVDNTYVYTIEGNTSSDEGVVENGGSVNDKKYKLSYSRIDGYGRPKYDEEYTPAKELKSIEEIAKEVLEGKWGNGDARKTALTKAGYNYSEVQKKVNELAKGKTSTKKYIKLSSGVWCRKGVGFKYKKYKVIPKNTKCELLGKNVGTSNGYKWDKIKYNNETVYLPNNWNVYL